METDPKSPKEEKPEASKSQRPVKKPDTELNDDDLDPVTGGTARTGGALKSKQTGAVLPYIARNPLYPNLQTNRP